MNVAGSSVVIPINGTMGIQHSWTYDVTMLDLYSKIFAFAPGGLIDVGANMGQTLLLFKSLFPDLPYVGFEPNPTCVGYLETLVAANGYSSCQVVSAALSDTNGIARLFLNDIVDSSASIIEKFRPAGPANPLIKYVTTLRLDEVSRTIDLSDTSVLKIDVEGSELEVIRGATSFIESVRPFIVCEILPTYDLSLPSNRMRHDRQSQLLRFLRERSYSFARFDHQTTKLTLLDTIEVHSEISMCDYLFLPDEQNFLAAPSEDPRSEQR